MLTIFGTEIYPKCTTPYDMFHKELKLTISSMGAVAYTWDSASD